MTNPNLLSCSRPGCPARTSYLYAGGLCLGCWIDRRLDAYYRPEPVTYPRLDQCGTIARRRKNILAILQDAGRPLSRVRICELAGEPTYIDSRYGGLRPAPTVVEALQYLESQGQIVTRNGKSGQCLHSIPECVK